MNRLTGGDAIGIYRRENLPCLGPISLLGFKRQSPSNKAVLVPVLADAYQSIVDKIILAPFGNLRKTSRVLGSFNSLVFIENDTFNYHSI